MFAWFSNRTYNASIFNKMPRILFLKRHFLTRINYFRVILQQALPSVRTPLASPRVTIFDLELLFCDKSYVFLRIRPSVLSLNLIENI